MPSGASLRAFSPRARKWASTSRAACARGRKQPVARAGVAGVAGWGAAELPAEIITELVSAFRGQVSYAYENYRDYHYCAMIFVFIAICYPIVAFFSLIVDGWDPYSELSEEDKKLDGGFNGDVFYIFRVTLHMFVILVKSFKQYRT